MHGNKKADSDGQPSCSFDMQQDYFHKKNVLIFYPTQCLEMCVRAIYLYVIVHFYEGLDGGGGGGGGSGINYSLKI